MTPKATPPPRCACGARATYWDIMRARYFCAACWTAETETRAVFLEGEIPKERKLVLVAIEPDGRCYNVTLPAASWDTLVSPAGVDQCWTPAIQTLRDFYAARKQA